MTKGLSELTNFFEQAGIAHQSYDDQSRTRQSKF